MPFWRARKSPGPEDGEGAGPGRQGRGQEGAGLQGAGPPGRGLRGSSESAGTPVAVRPVASGPEWPKLARSGAMGPPDPLMRGRLGATRLAREIHGLLDELGRTPGAMAVSLERAGVRGCPADPARSPVARYLCAIVGADPIVKALRVERDAVVVDLGAGWRPTVAVPVPHAVRAFNAAFDAGCYPSLVFVDRAARRSPADGT